MVLTAISMISWGAEIDGGDCDDWLMWWWCTPYWFKLRQKTDIFYVDEDADVGDYDGDIVHQVDGDEKLDPVRLAFLPLHALYTLDSAPTLQSCIWYNVAVDLEGVSANICGVWDKDDDNGDSNIRGDDDDDDSDDGFKMSDGDDSDDGSKWSILTGGGFFPGRRARFCEREIGQFKAFSSLFWFEKDTLPIQERLHHFNHFKVKMWKFKTIFWWHKVILIEGSLSTAIWSKSPGIWVNVRIHTEYPGLFLN